MAFKSTQKICIFFFVSSIFSKKKRKLSKVFLTKNTIPDVYNSKINRINGKSTSNSSSVFLVFTLPRIYFLFLFSRSLCVPVAGKGGQAKEAERFKWTRNQASWKRDVRMENLEWTEISAARDNRRRQYFNRRQIYRPREMANASNVPFRRSYPLLLASFPLTGGVIRRNKPTLRGEIIQERGTLSLSLFPAIDSWPINRRRGVER